MASGPLVVVCVYVFRLFRVSFLLPWILVLQCMYENLKYLQQIAQLLRLHDRNIFTHTHLLRQTKAKYLCEEKKAQKKIPNKINT